MPDDVDELFDTIRDLDPEEWRELSRRMRSQWFRQFRDAQQAYLDRLDEEGLLGRFGSGGGAFQPIPGEEHRWIEYCREHPNDPICLAGTPPAVGDRLSDFLDVREEYLEHLEEEGLLDLEEASQGPRFAGGGGQMAGLPGIPSPQPSRGGSDSPVGLTPPWPWPPWPWPPTGPWPPWPWPGPRPDPGPLGGGGSLAPMGAGGFQRPTAFDSRVGYTPAPDGPVWPPWPWPWPWPGPRPDPGPWFDRGFTGGNPFPGRR